MLVHVAGYFIDGYFPPGELIKFDESPDIGVGEVGKLHAIELKKLLVRVDGALRVTAAAVGEALVRIDVFECNVECK
jgi:hypothetical protein